MDGSDWFAVAVAVAAATYALWGVRRGSYFNGIRRVHRKHTPFAFWAGIAAVIPFSMLLLALFFGSL